MTAAAGKKFQELKDHEEFIDSIEKQLDKRVPIFREMDSIVTEKLEEIRALKASLVAASSASSASRTITASRAAIMVKVEESDSSSDGDESVQEAGVATASPAGVETASPKRRADKLLRCKRSRKQGRRGRKSRKHFAQPGVAWPLLD